ncbi:hypothetical protein FB45DRAFT_992216 [Roridomyces roridus]|uniref:Transmembrane protein 188 n=1 Tax=Roridomyces roridus TaxID=1738132 RepID=A0AAD7BHX2_9AGAR|nr:hypothetical protein FB45DRAFT_992216 [Roridomyces roridus]
MHMHMRPRSTPSPKSSVYPQNDVATYRDLLLFEERLKTTAASLQRRKSRYQLFLVQLLLIIVFLLAEVLLPPDISLIAIPCKLVLRRVLPDMYTEETEVGLLFVSVTTLALFFASGTYSDKIAYANKYPPLHSKFYFNPVSFFFPRPADPPPGPKSPATPPAITTTSASVPIPPIPPTLNPRGELRFSSRVDRSFRDGYERYRANFERKRAQQEQLGRGRGWLGRIVTWWRPDTPVSGARVSTEGVRSATPPIPARQREGGTPPTSPRRQRSVSPLQDNMPLDRRNSSLRGERK